MALSLLEEVADRVRQHPRLIFADDFEIAVESRRSRSSRFQGGGFIGEAADEGFWLSLRILHRKAPGSAVVTAFDDESVNRLVESAFHAAKCSTGDPWFRFPIWKKVEGDPSARMPTLPPSSLWSEAASGTGFLEERYESRHTETLLRRKTERITLKDSRAAFLAQLSAASGAGDGITLFREERSNRHGADGLKEVLSALTGDAESFSRAPLHPLKGKLSVLMAPQVASVLLSKVVPWFLADRLRHRQSPLSAQDPNHVFSPVLTLLDVGNHPESPHSTAFDCEGTLTRETTLVERGALRNLLFDTYEATRENRLSTGNWLKAPGASWPSIQPSTCLFRPAEQSSDALIREAGKGVWLRRVESLEAVSEHPSRFRLTACGQEISGGQAGGLMRGVSLEFDAFELLRKAVGVGSDLSLFGNHGSPSILFEKVPLGEV